MTPVVRSPRFHLFPPLGFHLRQCVCACVRALTYFVFVVDGGDAKGASEHASASPGQEEDRFPGYRLCRQTGS